MKSKGRIKDLVKEFKLCSYGYGYGYGAGYGYGYGDGSGYGSGDRHRYRPEISKEIWLLAGAEVIQMIAQTAEF